MSNVGVNKTIIEQTKNGFLCDSEEDWLTYFNALIQDSDLRKSIGEKGRETILKHYSTQAVREDFLGLFE